MTLLMIFGVKGAGKTTVMKYLAAKYDFHCVFNEDFYVRHQKHRSEFISNDRKVVGSIYMEVEDVLKELIKTSNVAYESTGAKPEWKKLVSNISDLRPVLIKVECSPDQAVERHMAEDKTGKHTAPDVKLHALEIVEMDKTSGVVPDFTIDNNGSVESIMRQVDEIAKKLGIRRVV